jgi:hypothetical protein
MLVVGGVRRLPRSNQGSCSYPELWHIVLVTFWMSDGASMAERLSDFPFVTVRVGCELCNRHGEYRLARLAAKYGSEITLDDLIDRIAHDCPRRRHPKDRRAGKYDLDCGVFFIDLHRPTRPPDLPPSKRKLVLVKGGKP